MPRTRIKRPRAKPAETPVAFVVVTIREAFSVRMPNGRRRLFDDPFAAFRYAESEASRLKTRTWIVGLPPPTGAARFPFHRAPREEDDD